MKNGGQGGSGPAMRRNRRTPSLPEPLGDDLRHDLIRVVDALAALVAQGEGERVGDVGRVGGRELVSMHRARIAERSERNKNMAGVFDKRPEWCSAKPRA